MAGTKFVMSVDVGTISTRCQIYNNQIDVVGRSSIDNKIIYPNPGYIELDPYQLWDTFLSVCRNAIEDASLTGEQISCLGISVLRNSFVTWNPKTDQCYHNIITWKDKRADKLCRDLNGSVKLKTVKAAAKIPYWMTKSKRFQAGSIFSYRNEMAIPRLLWVFKELPEINESISKGELLYGTVDTWLVWKLTKGAVHATDYTNVSVSGFFDPFVLGYSAITDFLFRLPKSILPNIKATNDDFGVTHKSYFNHEIPIRAIVGDQQAAMFGENCFNVGDIKCTLGTGSFLNLNTGSSPYASLGGFYPVIGWKLVNQEQLVYLMEGSIPDSGLIMKWGAAIDLFAKPEETADLAKSVQDSGGLHFIPSFSNNNSFGSLHGLTPSTSKAHIIRSILESLAFQIAKKIEDLRVETSIPIKNICLDGGVANNDFLLQCIADLTDKPIYRCQNIEMSSLGAALLAGLAVGIWKNTDEIKSLKKMGQIFNPSEHDYGLKERFFDWQKIVNSYKSCHI